MRKIIMEVEKRLLALTLVLTMLLVNVPEIYADEGGADAGKELADIRVLVGDSDLSLVHEGKKTDVVFPQGVSYQESTRTLSLSGAALNALWVEAGDVTILVNGENHITNTNTEWQAPMDIGQRASVTVTGNGSLQVHKEAPPRGMNEALYIQEKALFKLTGSNCEMRVTSNRENGDSDACAIGGGGSFIVTDGATLYAYGERDGFTSGGGLTVDFTDCKIYTNRITFVTDALGEGSAPCLMTIGAGAEVEVAPFEGDAKGERIERIGMYKGSSLTIDGGTLKVREEKLETTGHTMIDFSNSTLEIRDGVLDIFDQAENCDSNVMYVYGGIYRQIGGTVRIKRTKDTGAAGLDIENSEFCVNGGSLEIENGCGFVNGGGIVVNGGSFSMEGKNGLHLQNAASLSVLDGTFALTGGLLVERGSARFLGGSATISGSGKSGKAFDIVVRQPDNTVTFGPNMFMTADGKASTAKNMADREFLNGVSKAVISGNGGEYAVDLSVTSGQTTMGVPFSVRSIFALGAAKGSVVYDFPDAISYVPGSLAINGKLTDDAGLYSERKLNLDLANGDIVRFNAYAGEEGDYTIHAKVRGKDGVRDESLAVHVKGFTLNMPAQTNSRIVPVSGQAASGCTIMLFDNGKEAGQAEANSLGGWNVDMNLQSTEKEHEVSAKIKYEGRETESRCVRLLYDPSVAEVETLTITNTIHGARDGDAPVESKVVINYKERTSTPNYGTYWPDLPEFNFRVKFTDASDTSDITVVEVVMTDIEGTESRVYLTKETKSGCWVGSVLVDDINVYAPESFRVEWRTKAFSYEGSTGNAVMSRGDDGTNSADQAEGSVRSTNGSNRKSGDADSNSSNQKAGGSDSGSSDDGGTDGGKGEDFDESDGYPIVAGKSTFKVKVKKGADYKVENLFGEAVKKGTAYTVKENVITLKAMSGNGSLYILRGTAGTFTDYPNQKTLFVMLAGEGKPAAGSYTYKSAVRQVKEIPKTPGADGTVYVVDDKEAWTVEGGKYVTASLEDVYETLSVTQSDIIEGRIDCEQYIGEMEEQIRQSGFYGAVVEAAEMTAKGAGISIDAGLPVKVTVTPDLRVREDKSGQRVIEFDLEVVMEIKSGNLKIEVTLKTSSDKKIFDAVQYANGKAGTYLMFDDTSTFSVDVQVKGEKSLEDTNDATLKAYFNENLTKKTLEKINEKKEEKESSLTLLKEIPIPTSVPGVCVVFKLSLDYNVAASGSLGYNYTSTTKSTGGFIDVNGKTQKAYEQKITDKTVGAFSHVSISLEVGPTVSFGVRVLNLIRACIYVHAGVEAAIGGHYVYFSTDRAKPGAEIYIGVSAVARAGVSIALVVTKRLSFEVSHDICAINYPLLSCGDKRMPYKFTSEDYKEDNPLLVSGDCNLKSELDLRLDYQEFGTSGDSEGEGKQVFRTDHYEFEMVKAVEGISVTKDGMLSIAENAKPAKFQVKVTYYGSDRERFNLYTTFTLLYNPSSVIIHKTADGKGQSALFLVNDIEGKNAFYCTTGGDGYAIVEAKTGHTYRITEVGCPTGYIGITPPQVVKAGKSVEFANVPIEPAPEGFFSTQETPIGFIGDPSGFVYEGAEGFRLSGVTTTLYYSREKPKEGMTAEEEQRWDAAGYDQANPLTTDVLGRYMWMVPSGWWQVKYEKEGYETAYSEWLQVPPVQTDVNIGLVTKEKAKMTVSADTSGVVKLVFSHPVLVSTMESASLTVKIGNKVQKGTCYSVDTDWMPDGRTCATVFEFKISGAAPQKGKTVSVTVKGVATYAGVDSSAKAGVKVKAAAGLKKGSRLTVMGITYQVTGTKKVKVVKVKPGALKKGRLTIGAAVTYQKVKYKITAVGKNACKNNKKLKEITLGKNVVSAQANAFAGCKALKKITVKSAKFKIAGGRGFKGISTKTVIKKPANEKRKRG